MAGHWWTYEPEWMETRAGKHVGGFSRCRYCGLMRFSRPGYPPHHYYVRRAVLDGLKNTTAVRPGAVDVMNLAPECCGPTPTQGSLF